MIDAADMTPLERRFWALVDIRRLPDGTLDFEKCWEWKGCRTRPSSGHKSHPGYGQFRKESVKGKGKRVKAHRFAWELWHGEAMPEELDAAHVTCDNPPCCNPTHVEPQSHKRNWSEFLQRYQSPHGKHRERSA